MHRANAFGSAADVLREDFGDDATRMATRPPAARAQADLRLSPPPPPPAWAIDLFTRVARAVAGATPRPQR